MNFQLSIQQKTRLDYYCPNGSMKTRNTENNLTNEPYKFVLDLSQRLHLKSSNKHVALQNLYIYYTWKSKDNNTKTRNSK